MRSPLCSLLVLALPAAALAGPAVDDVYAPAAPSAAEQLAASEVKLVEGQGGLLVPALASEQEEPRFALVDGDTTRVLPVGTRIALEPGRYVVLVGSLDPSEAVAIPVVIEAGRDTVVPLRWGGLRIETNNRRGKPTDAEVRIERVSTGTVVETPPRLIGDNPPTVMLLPPGLYRVSSQPDAGTKEAATVHVPAGGYVRYEVVLGAADRLVGARVVASDDMPEQMPPPSGWNATVALGADASFTQNQATAGFPEVVIATGSASLDFDVEFVSKRHRFDAGAGIREGGFLFRPPNAAPLPIIKTRDKLYADLGYEVRFNAGLGIYVRTSGETQILPTAVAVTEPSTVRLERQDGTVGTVTLGANDTFRIADAFSPTVVRASAGLAGTLVDGKVVSFTFGVGPGYRYHWMRGAYVAERTEPGEGPYYREVQNFQLFGAEGNVALTFRGGRYFRYETGVDVFVPFTSPADVIVDWTNRLVVDLGRGFALQYTADLTRIPQITERLVFFQSAGINITFNVL